MYGNLIPQIRAALDSLRPAERKVAEVVLADVDFAMRASITDLADRSEVSQPSVTRFCRAVECEGLRDLKLQLARSIATGVPYATKTIAVDDDIKTMTDKVSDAASEGIALMRQTLDPAAMEAAISALVSARRICVFGVGSGSGLVAADSGVRFLRLDIGARTPLAWMVDIPLLLRLPSVADPNTRGVPRLVHLCVIDALAIGVALRLEPQTLEKLRNAKARLPRDKSPLQRKI